MVFKRIEIDIVDSNFSHHEKCDRANGIYSSFKFITLNKINNISESKNKICIITDKHFKDLRVSDLKNKKDTIKIAWLIEPYTIEPDIYRQVFSDKLYNEFDYIYYHSIPGLYINESDEDQKCVWVPNGGCHIKPSDFGVIKREYSFGLERVLYLTTDKNFTPDQKLRLNFAKLVEDKNHQLIPDSKFEYEYSGIDLYGKGFYPFIYKYDLLENYRYGLVWENTTKDYYFSEKLIDLLITGTIPIVFESYGEILQSINNLPPFIGATPYKFDLDGMIVIPEKYRTDNELLLQLFSDPSNLNLYITRKNESAKDVSNRFMKGKLRNYCAALGYVNPDEFIYNHLKSLEV